MKSGRFYEDYLIWAALPHWHTILHSEREHTL